MASLLVIALLSATGTLVDSASKITGCDSMPDSATCYQYACDQPPCSILCGQSSSFDRCVQTCNGSACSTMVCSSSVQNCQQNCPSGNCTDYKCDAGMCFQNCQGEKDYCKTMRCTNSNPGTTCEQSDGKELFCDSERCDQNCAKKCKMTCSSSVKECKQSCLSGGCTYQCNAKRCELSCPGGNCRKIEAPTKPASTITGCDPMPDNATCYQYACDHPPCSILCGQSSSFDRCVQTCNGSTCNTMVCSSSVQNCQQNCPSGNCTDYKCDAKMCFQNCQGDKDYCKTMRCTNSNPGTTCEQSDGKELFCDSERCDQNCAKKCNMSCSSSVKECTQNCQNGGCTYQCDAEKCNLDCPGDNCTKIKSPTKAPTGTGTRLQLAILLVPGLILAMVVFM